ncbi:LOW QUALITY PROTEIN: hypothetical protein QYF61_023684 [Mycteria americana]|uniref:Uncharacterized protein n=1 Tax=Mycteria americana TaxID=33587 RepID=A0AAN7MP99_MYCAM|nr:LOW QUALITY PROTEIN: hypothetical protein QYF61_023684 [Mycteria americana]
MPVDVSTAVPPIRYSPLCSSASAVPQHIQPQGACPCQPRAADALGQVSCVLPPLPVANHRHRNTRSNACLRGNNNGKNYIPFPAHPPYQPVPMFDNPFSKEIFPNIQSKPLLTQLEAISSHPITSYLGEETDPHLSTPSFQVAVESDEVSPQPPFLQAQQPQFPQPLPIRLVLQTLHQLRCPSLDTLQPLNVSLGVRGPKLNTAFEVRPHQCRVQGDNHFPTPAGHTIPDTSQDAIGFLGRLGTLLAHIQPAVDQHPQVLFCQAAFQPLFPKPVALHGVVVTQVWDPALGLVKPHTINLSPSIQPVQIPLSFLPSSRSTLPPKLVSSANLLRVHSIPSSRSLIKILNKTGPKTEPWGTPLRTVLRKSGLGNQGLGYNKSPKPIDISQNEEASREWDWDEIQLWLAKVLFESSHETLLLEQPRKAFQPPAIARLTAERKIWDLIHVAIKKRRVVICSLGMENYRSHTEDTEAELLGNPEGLLKIWALTSSLQAPQDLPGVGLPLTLFSSSLHCSTVSEPYQYEQGDEGGCWRFVDYLTNGATFCYQRGGDILHCLDAIHQKMSVTLLKPVGIAKEQALLSSVFKEKCSRMVRGKDRTLGSPGLLSQLCKLFRDSFSSTEINETLY